jgi:CheY-like chemotaxis protein
MNGSKSQVIQGKIRVLIVDDIPQVRQGLSTMLNLAARNILPQIEVIGEAQNGSEAIQQALILHPDVVLMDLEMPVLDGCTATQCIKSTNPSILIVILTIHSDPATRQKANCWGRCLCRKGALIEIFYRQSNDVDIMKTDYQFSCFEPHDRPFKRFTGRSLL